MHFNQEYIANLKATVDLVDLVSQYTELKKKGNIYSGTCPHPDHTDSTPSLIVWEGERGWACMGCHSGKKDETNYGSDCIAFVRWIEKLSFQKAVEFLANMYEIPLPDDKLERLYVNHLNLAEEYHNNLVLDTDSVAYNYLIKERGLSNDDINDWYLGYNDKTNRIVFPLPDSSGRIIGFTNRAIGPELPKYINSTSSDIFTKGKYFYGLHAVKSKRIKIAEGPMDVIMATKYGVTDIVATLGTAMTDQHIAYLKSNNYSVVLCYDGDKPGLRATIKSAERLYSAGISVSVFTPPEDKDICDMCQSMAGEVIDNYIELNSISYLIYKVRDMVSSYISKIADLKIQYIPAIMALTNSSTTDMEKQVIKGILESLGIKEED